MQYLVNKTMKYTVSEMTHLTRLIASGVLMLAITTPIAATAAEDFQGNLTGVSITDADEANQAPVAQFTYTQDGDSFTFDASESYDSDGSIATYQWDFGDGSTSTGAQASYTYSDLTSSTVTLTVIDDESGVSLTQQTVSLEKPFSLAVNFQPASADVPSGYVVDSGGDYNDSNGYGWTTSPSSQGTRDRDNTASPDQAYDTMIHVDPSGVWEAEIPNGSYTITICAGDPGYPVGTPNIQAEGVTVISGESLSRSEPYWIEKDIVIEVTDSRLTVTFSGSTDPARLCWLKISNS